MPYWLLYITSNFIVLPLVWLLFYSGIKGMAGEILSRPLRFLSGCSLIFATTWLIFQYVKFLERMYPK